MFRKLYNPDAHADNTLQILDSDSGCCGSDATACAYTADDVDVSTVNGIIYIDDAGAEQTIAFAAAATSLPDLRRKLATALKTIGYVEDDERSVQAQANGSNYDLQVVSELELHAFTTTAADVDFTKKCTMVPICSYKVLYAGGSSIDLTVDGSTVALNTAAYGTAGATAALIAALEGGGFAAKFWKVVENDTLQKWEVYVKGNPNSTTVVYDGTAVERCDCWQGWEA